ncbi:carbohydrate-binding family 9-like protein [Chitinophaga sp. MM2321]|uniref:carbohydrate-binding family 9-like protein n=1 Tax=Chitinophaga sp. MM2321 TaxID=3137178 RepID=UPI0032D57CFF
MLAWLFSCLCYFHSDTFFIKDLQPADSLLSYKVRLIADNTMNIHQAAEAVWAQCAEISPLYEPWQHMNGGTSFRACYDSQHFYFRFMVKDTTPVSFEVENELAVADGDRVEMFFSKDNTLQDYYCLEMSPNGKVLDYQAAYYRIFNNTWNLKGLVISASAHDRGYQVSGSIPLRFFRDLVGAGGSLKGSKIRVGVFRADKTATDFNWFSWINPGVPEPDFHIPAALGLFEF